MIQKKTTKDNYRSILKATSLIGGASVINILIGMVRTKFIAVLLGPSGVGLLGLFNQISTLIGTATDLGIGSSGVRQVAEAVSTGDDNLIAKTVITLRRACWLTGILGPLVTVALCVPISRITFKTDDYAVPIAFLGGTLFFASIAAGQSCLLRGTRRIADVARISVIGALSSTLISIPCYYLWGLQGIVPGLIFSSIAVLLTSWWYARRVPVRAIVLSWRESIREARSLLLLGMSFMGAALITSASTYLIQTLLARQFSITDVGIYQAAFSLSGVLVNFVLGAMAADYYPGLTGVAADNAAVHRMVNEQSRISLLLALPCLSAMMIFAPFIIKLFYADSFAASIPILRWCVLGMLGRVFSWPLGFVMLAKGKGKLFLITETLGSALHLAAVFFFIQMWGLNGAGIAFMFLYVGYTAMVLWVVHYLTGNSWTRDTVRMVVISSAVMAGLMLNCFFNSNKFALWPSNFIMLTCITAVCLRQLSSITGIGLKALTAKIDFKQR